MDILAIVKLSRRDSFTLDAMMLKHVEECGELAKAVVLKSSKWERRISKREAEEKKK